jgi:hypothetical protein
MFRKIPFKTIGGSVLIALSFIPKFAAFAPYLLASGTALGGVGVADKLDKIKEALTK